ncbi:MAG: hypothetical protein D6698_07100, partial [Gammaproteobacteria bacterium]
MPSRNSTPHILACITPHGFGHAAQITTVLNSLRTQIKNLQISLMSGAPLDLLKSRLRPPFSLYPMPHDPGMLMADALGVQPDASLEAHRNILEDWESIIAELEKQVAIIQPDLVIGNIPYTIPVVCNSLKIPCINLCSLN